MCYSGLCPHEGSSGDCNLPHDEMIKYHEKLEETMSLYDPPSDPEYCAHECKECDQPLKREQFTREWICVNADCPRSPYYKEPTGCCVSCGDVIYSVDSLCDECRSTYTQEYDDFTDADPGL